MKTTFIKNDATTYIVNKKRILSNGDKTLFKGTLILAVGSFVSKVLGALYRIPLTSILGSDGLGIYQTAFPVYCILLTFSSTGVPSAIAKLISGGYDENKVLKTALKLFILLGVLGSALMIGLSGFISLLQGNPKAKLSYIFLAPSVALVSIISCIRGYFQGKCNMTPTAISQIMEQFVKLTFGLTLCYFINGGPKLKGGLACLAVSISESVALIYLSLYYKKHKTTPIYGNNISIKRLIATLLPITLTTIILPISRTFDSFTIVNILNRYTPNATSYYGIYTGSVESVLGVPVAVCYGIATASLPTITKAFSKNDEDKVRTEIFKSFSLTFFLSTLLGLLLYLFSNLITETLFGGLLFHEKNLITKLLALSFFSVIGLSLTQTLNTCLIAIGKPYLSAINLGIGVAIKFIAQFILLKIPSINIFGALYSDILSYFVAVFLNLLYIIYNTNKQKGKGSKWKLHSSE